MNSALRKIAASLTLTSMLLTACGTNLWGTYDPNLTPTPPSTVTPIETIPTDLNPSSTKIIDPLSLTQTATVPPTPAATPTNVMLTPGTPSPIYYYSSQSGDSLEAVALHFNVPIANITSLMTLPATGLLNPNTPLMIPNLFLKSSTTPAQQILPDCEVVYSPCAQSFNTESYVNSLGGKLSTFREPRGSSMISGSGLVQMAAFGSSISPRMLLTLIQYYTGWVEGQPKPGVDETYPLGYRDPLSPGLYQQLRLIIRELLAGYYGWRDGTLTSLTFPDGNKLQLAPTLNAGTVAVQYTFSRHLNYADWLLAIDPANANSFPALFASMFGDTWERAQEYEPLFPVDLAQPIFILPFETGVPWTLTSGPHPAWEQESALAALDFAPPLNSSPCESNDWVVAIAPGLIVRSGDGFVVLDLDNDGFEQTGWVVLYQHMATKDRIPVGSSVNAGDWIGHPSCEGGPATGANLHIARKYNGEWLSAGDPLPFIMSGWTAHAGDQMRQGTMTKGDQTVTASSVSERQSQIIRKPGE
jgi:LasA protease